MTIKAMLAEDMITNQAKKYIQNDAWWAEQKIDGQRLLIRIENNKVSAFNRQGEQMHLKNNALQETFASGFNNLWWFDGEYLDDHYYIFDVLEAKGTGWTNKPYADRRAFLEKLFVLIDGEVVHLVPVARTEDEKIAMFKYTKHEGYEGMIFKPHTSEYLAGSKGTWKKLKHYKTADCFVVELNRGDKDQAVTLGLLDENDKVQEVGGLKVPHHYLKDAKVGDVIEVRYLYSTESGKLYIPSFLRSRVDKQATECYTSQLVPTVKQVIKDYT